MTNMNQGSELARTLKEVALYPPHPPRRATPRYQKSHHKIVVEEDRPCLGCGVRNSTLHDPAQNRWGAKQIETHHHTCEDSLANAVDVDKFNKRVLPGLLRKTGDQEKYGHPFTRDEMVDWIHGDEDNLWALCDQCHRHPYIGIHAITGPIWGVQDLLLDGYDLTGYVPTTPHEGAQLAALPHTTGVPAATGVTAPERKVQG